MNKIKLAFKLTISGVVLMFAVAYTSEYLTGWIKTPTMILLVFIMIISYGVALWYWITGIEELNEHP